MMSHPTHIFTNFYNILHIVLSHKDDSVLLSGTYGNIQTDEMNPIEVAMDFSTRYDLCTEAKDSEYILVAIANALEKPGGDYTTLDVSGRGGLEFHDHLFDFLLINEWEIDGKIYRAEKPSYCLIAFIPLEDFLPQFMDSPIPESPAGRADYLQRQLAINYRFYLHFKTTWPEEDALFFSNLRDPLHFPLAQVQFENCHQNSCSKENAAYSN